MLHVSISDKGVQSAEVYYIFATLWYQGSNKQKNVLLGTVSGEIRVIFIEHPSEDMLELVD